MPITKNNPLRTVSECMQCGESFKSLTELKEHIRKVHMKDRLIQFNEPKAPLEEKEKPVETPKTEEVKSVDVPFHTPATPVRKATPVVLEYRFKGECEDCFHEVDTIEMEVDEKLFMVAYCNSCRKKRQEIKVIPIDQQFKK